jgi:hypothetical protein
MGATEDEIRQAEQMARDAMMKRMDSPLPDGSLLHLALPEKAEQI